jgi:hypothetical protein
MHFRAWSLLSCEVSVRVRGNPPVTPLGTLEHKRFQNGIRLEVKLVSAPDMRFVVQHFRTPAFQQEMWVKILPCAPQYAVVIQQPGCLPSKQRTRVQVPPTAPKISSLEILHSSSSGLRHLIAIQETKVRFLPIAPNGNTSSHMGS